MQEALAAATKEGRQLLVSNLDYCLGWQQVKHWFQEFLAGLLDGGAGGAVTFCRLFESKRLGCRNSGRGLVNFDSPEAVRAILQKAQPAQQTRHSMDSAG